MPVGVGIDHIRCGKKPVVLRSPAPEALFPVEALPGEASGGAGIRGNGIRPFLIPMMISDSAAGMLANNAKPAAAIIASGLSGLSGLSGCAERETGNRKEAMRAPDVSFLGTILRPL